MNPFKLACAIAAVGVVIGAGVARANELKITKDGQTTRHDCGGQDVVIGASRSQITLRGACAEVDVKGSENTIRIETASKLEIWGSSNSIEVVATNKIQAAGNDNRVKYVRGLRKKLPAKKLWGKRNVLKRVAKLPAAGDAPIGGDAPRSGGAPETGDARGSGVAPRSGDAPALREVKPIVCERNDRVKLDGVLIRTAGMAITTQGNCRLTVTNSKLVSTGGAAVQTAGSTIVTLDNVEVEGRYGSVMNAGSAMVTIRRSTLRGLFAAQGSSTVQLENSTVYGGRSVTSSATYVDGGGNKFHER